MMERNDSEIISVGEFSRNQVRARCSATRGAFCRAVTRAVLLLASIDCGAGKPSAESFDTASTSSTHAMNMSPGATLILYFLSRRPSPRSDDYSRMGERV